MGKRAAPNRLPTALRDLAESHEVYAAEHRTLYAPELKALCKVLQDGVPEPYPGMHVAAKSLPVDGGEANRRAYVINFDLGFAPAGQDHNVVMLITVPWRGDKEPALSPLTIDRHRVYFDRARLGIEEVALVDGALRSGAGAGVNHAG